MTRTMQDPLLKDLPAGRVQMDCAGVGHPARRLAPRHHLGQRRFLPCLSEDVLAVDRVDGLVGIAMEDDGRHRSRVVLIPSRQRMKSPIAVRMLPPPAMLWDATI